MIFELRRCPLFEVSAGGASRELSQSPAGDESGEARAELREKRAQAG